MNLLGKDERNLKQNAKEIEYLLVSLYNRMVCIYTLLGNFDPSTNLTTRASILGRV